MANGFPARSAPNFVSIVVLMYLLAVAIYSSIQSIFRVTSPMLGDLLMMVINLILFGLGLWGLREAYISEEAIFFLADYLALGCEIYLSKPSGSGRNLWVETRLR